MNQEQAGQDFPISDRIPQRINEGMIVYDREGQVVGIVQVVYFGGASEEAIERVLHPEEAPAAQHGETDWSVFDADDVPKELRARFMKQGYILVEGSDLTGIKRYIGPEQIEGVFSEEIEGVMKDAVRLRPTRDELLNT
jgi:hypothetical protein